MNPRRKEPKQRKELVTFLAGAGVYTSEARRE
jgi:hypothetical protein